MNEAAERQERSAPIGRGEFPPLPELQPGSPLTPLDPSLINPIIRAYNALVRSRGEGKTADGLNTLRTLLTAGGFVVEIVPTPNQTAPIGELPPQGGGGTSTSGLTYGGLWSSFGEYPKDTLVIDSDPNSQLGLFIRITETGGAGIEPWATGYTTDWTLIGRYFTTILQVQDTTTKTFRVAAALPSAKMQNGSDLIWEIDLSANSFSKTQKNATAFSRYNIADMTQRFQITNTEFIQVDLPNSLLTFQKSNTEQVLVNTNSGIVSVRSNSIYSNVVAGTVTVIDSGGRFTEVSREGVYSRNNANTASFRYNSSSENTTIHFADGGQIHMTKADCEGKNIALRDYDYCSGESLRTVKLLGSEPY